MATLPSRLATPAVSLPSPSFLAPGGQGFHFNDPNLQAFADRILSTLSSGPSIGSNGMGGSSGVPGWHPLDYSAGDSQQSAMDQVLGRPENVRYKGVKYEELPPELRSTIDSIYNMNQQTQAMGGKVHHHNSVLNRVFDVLSRPLYAVATPLYHDLELGAKKDTNPLDYMKNQATGFWQGLSGKEKVHFSDVIQHGFDISKGLKEGKSPTDPGIVDKAKVNPWLKYGAGLALDIAGDPTTYLGVGLAKDALEVPVEAKNLINAAKSADSVANDSARLNSITKAAKDLGVEIATTPEGKLVANTPENQAKFLEPLGPAPSSNVIADVLGAGRRGVPESRGEIERAKNAAHQITMAIVDIHRPEDLALATEHVNSTMQGLRPILTKEEIMPHYREKFGFSREDEHATAFPGEAVPHPSQLDPWAWHEARATAETKAGRIFNMHMQEYRKAINAKAAELSKARAEELTDLIARMHDPTTRTRIAIRVGKGKMGVKGSDHVVTGLSKAVKAARENSVKFDDSVKWFQKRFVNSGGFGKDLNAIRSMVSGGANALLHYRYDQLNKIFMHQPAALRHDAWNVYRNGMAGTTPVLTTDGSVDMAKFIDEHMKDLKQSIHDLGNDPSILNKYVDRKKFAFGGAKDIKPGDTSWVDKSIENWGTQDPGEILWVLHNAVTKAAARNSMWNTAAEHLGIFAPKGRAHPSLGILRNKYGYETIKEIPELANHIFHPEVAEQIRKLKSALEEKSIMRGEVGASIDKAQHYWKSLVTVYNPGFWQRNMIGDVFVAWLAGVKDPQAYRRAYTVMKYRGGADNVLLPDAAKALRDKSSTHGKTVMLNKNGSGRPFRDLKGGHIDSDLLWALYNKYGLKQGYVSSELAHQLPKFTKLSEFDEKIRRTSELREDYFRMAHFVDKIRNSKAATLEEAAQEAADSVRKFHFDYNDFTEFEKVVMSRVIPFYKWTRKSLPLMAETLLTQPGKAVLYPKVSRALSGLLGFDVTQKNYGLSDIVVPQYLKDSAAAPIGFLNGNTTFLNPAIPLNDSLKWADDPFGNIMSATSPFIRDPFELAAGKTLFSGVPIDRGALRGNQGLLHYLMQQSPQSAVASKVYNDYSQPDNPNAPVGFNGRTPQNAGNTGILQNPDIINFLLALGISSNTQRTMRGELQRERNAAISQRKGAKQKYDQKNGFQG